MESGRVPVAVSIGAAHGLAMRPRATSRYETFLVRRLTKSTRTYSPSRSGVA